MVMCAHFLSEIEAQEKADDLLRITLRPSLLSAQSSFQLAPLTKQVGIIPSSFVETLVGPQSPLWPLQGWGSRHSAGPKKPSLPKETEMRPELWHIAPGGP